MKIENGKWKTVRLGDVCEIARGGSPRPINDYITTAENCINWIKIGDTSSDSKYIKHTEQKIKPEGMKNRDMSILVILFCLTQ